MSEFRMGKNTTAHYTSFKELGAAFGCKPIKKQTDDVDKLNSQREKFCSRHKCKACGKPMVFYPNSNVMMCINENCKGIKVEKEDKEGNKIVTYLASYDLLDELGTEIANNIFA